MGRSAKWYPFGTTLDDTPIVLDDGTPAPMFVMKGVTGIEAPPYELELQRTPGVRGARFIKAVSSPRTIRVPIHLCAPTRAQMLRLKQDLIDAIDPEEGGQGILALSDAIGESSGEVRCIDAVYGGGLEGDESAMKVGRGATYWEFMVEFVGLDTWWSPEPVVAEWAGRAGAPFFPFGFPFVLAPSGLDVTVPLDLSGNATSYPAFRLDPPFTRVKVTNPRTREWWEVRQSTDTRFTGLTVDTQPGQVRVRTDTGGNGYGQLVGGSVLFGLKPGDDVTAEAEGTAGSTLVHLEALQRWKSGP